MLRSISTLPLVHPAATTPGADLALAISAGARAGSTVRLMVCSPARSASQEIERLFRLTSTASPFRLLRNSSAASSFTRTPMDSGDTAVKSFGAGVMPSSVVWLSWNSFSLRSELSVEATSVTAWPMVIWPRNSTLSPLPLRASFTVTGILSPRLCVDPVIFGPLTVRLTTKRSLRSEPFSTG